MATDYGRDMSGGIDLTPTLLDVTGDELMRQVILRRLYTPNASLISAPDEVTCDLRDFLSTEQGVRDADLRTIKGTATSALLADPRIFSAAIVIDEWDPSSGALVMRVTGEGATGPFRLVLQVTQLTIDVLE
jgi:hypothetical protein